MPGTLYIVATPIGNLADVTFRAIEILKSVDLVLSEDTRKTKILLDHYNINTQTLSYHQQSSDDKKNQILLNLLEGKNLALVTDAGTPGVADPGNELISFLLEREPNINIIPIPGASSLTASLSICGFDVSKFFFLGFMPKKKHTKIFKQIEDASFPVVFFESPHRILKTVDELMEKFGEEREVFIGQELTKIHERKLNGNLKEVKAVLINEKNEIGRVKGEIVVILNVRER